MSRSFHYRSRHPSPPPTGQLGGTERKGWSYLVASNKEALLLAFLLSGCFTCGGKIKVLEDSDLEEKNFETLKKTHIFEHCFPFRMVKIVWAMLPCLYIEWCLFHPKVCGFWRLPVPEARWKWATQHLPTNLHFKAGQKSRVISLCVLVNLWLIDWRLMLIVYI